MENGIGFSTTSENGEMQVMYVELTKWAITLFEPKLHLVFSSKFKKFSPQTYTKV